MAPHVTTIILLYDFTTLLALILKHILIQMTCLTLTKL